MAKSEHGNVFITGAGRRIGAGLARAFAARGWNVALHYHRSEAEARALHKELVEGCGVRAELYRADIADKAAISRAIQEAAGALGALDVLVNNAGVFPAATPLAEIDEQHWRRTLDVNLNGAFFAAQEFARHCSERAAIINMASLGAFETWKHRIPYSVSKAALVQLTRALARELAPRISVNSVAPGLIVIPGEEAGGAGYPPLKRFPAGRYGRVEDIFEAVWFFARASGYVTGQCLVVDGGYGLSR